MKTRWFYAHSLGSLLSLLCLAAILAATPACSKQGKAVAVGKVAERPDDIALGDPAAPVQIIEYASMTCPHCAAFHAEVLPKLKAAYVETGKVRFIFREFPLDDYATQAAMTARCRPRELYLDTVAYIFERQMYWAGAESESEILPRLQEVLKETTMTEADFKRCTSDQALLTQVREIAAEGTKLFQVKSTPTFIINGHKYSGELSFERFEAILAPLLKMP